ncbi:MAG: hypothetical protein ACTSR8_11400 [Promethearchaeota archaeon]
MVNVIQDLWIFLKTGIVLFDRVFDENVDANLFGAMMSALDNFATEISGGGITSFELRDKCFSILEKKDVLFVATYPKKNKEKKVVQELHKISNRFFELYTIDIDNFEGEVSQYRAFEKEIDDSLEQVIDKMQKGFW